MTLGGSAIVQALGQRIEELEKRNAKLERVAAAYREAYEARGAFLAAYRLGTSPREKDHKRMDRARTALANLETPDE